MLQVNQWWMSNHVNNILLAIERYYSRLTFSSTMVQINSKLFQINWTMVQINYPVYK